MTVNLKKIFYAYGLYLKFGLYRIPVYSKFSLGRLHCIRSIDKSWMLHASYQQ
jgi:hypothetical protein